MTTGYVAGYASDCGCCVSRQFGYTVLTIDRNSDMSQAPVIGTTGTLNLRRNPESQGSTQYDVTLDLDLAHAEPSIIGEPCGEVYYWTVTIPLLLDDQNVGQVTMKYVSGSPASGKIDLDITFDSQRWYGDCNWAYHYAAYGIVSYCTLTEITP